MHCFFPRRIICFDERIFTNEIKGCETKQQKKTDKFVMQNPYISSYAFEIMAVCFHAESSHLSADINVVDENKSLLVHCCMFYIRSVYF